MLLRSTLFRSLRSSSSVLQILFLPCAVIPSAPRLNHCSRSNFSSASSPSALLSPSSGESLQSIRNDLKVVDVDIAKFYAAGEFDKVLSLMSIRLGLQNRLEAQFKQRALELEAQAKKEAIQAHQRPYLSLPLPHPFQEISLDGDPHTMMVVPSVPGSSIVGPTFLSKEAHSGLEDFCQNVVPFQPLIIFGPPKCSKSSVLHHLLPSMAVSRPCNRSPVFVRLEFWPTNDPAIRIGIELSQVVDAFGLTTETSQSTDTAKLYVSIPGWIASIGAEFEKRNQQLWIMMDECQNPLFNADTFAEAELFMSMLKEMISQAGMHTRFVFTGSSMLTFLQCLLKVEPNGLQVFNAAKFVLLAQPAPSEAWALRMVRDIKRARIEAFSQLNAALSSFLSNLDDADVLKIIRQHPDVINIRPAIIDRLLIFSGDSLDGSMKILLNGIDDETGIDFLRATHALRDEPHILEPMRQLALGTTKASELLPGLPMEAKLLSFLCGVIGFKPENDHQVMRLVPPYASLCQKRIMEHGIVNTANDRALFRCEELKLSFQFGHIMTWFVESQHTFDEADQKFISDSIVECLLDLGIGIPQPDGSLIGVQSVLDVPMLRDLHHAAQGKPQLFEYQRWKASGEVGPPPGKLLVGLQIMSDLRIVWSYFPLSLSDLVKKRGWSFQMLERIAAAFRDCYLLLK